MKTRQMIIYRNFKYQQLFDDMTKLLLPETSINEDSMPGDFTPWNFTSGNSMTENSMTENSANGNLMMKHETMPDSYDCANQLIELAAAYGFEGNLWHCFLALCAASHENAYSTACEIRGELDGTLKTLALHDFRILKELYDCDITVLDGNEDRGKAGDRSSGGDRNGDSDQDGDNEKDGDSNQDGNQVSKSGGIWASLADYRAADSGSRIFNRRIRDRILELSRALSKAADGEDFQAAVTEFYREFGVGKFGLNKAFRIVEEKGQAVIEPIVNVEHIYLNDIIGYELQKEKLIANTESFIRGGAANNVLLFGDAGTGKSSSIKAVLNEYYNQGLRIIEVYKHQFHALSSVLEQVQDRNYKFIIYMDDLSFEESELEYKYLKAIIEGGLGRKPNNVLIYATSNRRHLIREKFSDKRELDDELHENDTVQEKLSLVARFGVTIYFGAPDKKEFQNIVRLLAEKYGVEMPVEELYAEANKWELSHGGLSGRTAAQFITHLLGCLGISDRKLSR